MVNGLQPVLLTAAPKSRKSKNNIFFETPVEICPRPSTKSRIAASGGPGLSSLGVFMKKVLTYILSALVTIISLILIIASFQANHWTVERSVLIDAPRDKVWAIVSDLNRYSEWNPYARLDPEARITVTGPAATVGSSYAWDGKQSGAGRMTTVALDHGSRIDFQLAFERPMSVINQASFLVGPQESPTKMTWSMQGHHQGFAGLVSRALHLFISIDAMVGQQFESGLATLKGIAEDTSGSSANTP